MYHNDLRNEKGSGRKVVLTPGWHTFEVVGIEEKTSKAGNPMFVAELAEDKTMHTINVFMVATEGKAWMLKQFLTAVNAPVDEEGVFTWDVANVMGKRLEGFVENEPNDWIDRDGKTQTSHQSKVMEFKSL